MPHIRPKPPEVLQAQAAAFAVEYPCYGDGSDLAQETFKPVDGTEATLEEAVRQTEYIDFLRKTGGQNNPQVQERADMIKRYEEFAPKVGALMAELEDSWLSHPDFIGMGRTSAAFRLDHEGQSYALRIPTEQEEYGLDSEYVNPSVYAKGKDGMEQMVAVSYEDSVTISEFMPGKGMDEMTTEEVAKVPDEHMEGLAETIAAIHGSGLLIDSNSANVLYDSEAGFSFIDLSHKSQVGGPILGGRDLASMLTLGGDLLLGPMHKIVKEIEDTEEGLVGNQKIAELYDVFIPVIARYKKICSKKFADNENLDAIDYQLEVRLKRLIEYRDSLGKPIEQEVAAVA